MLTLCGLILLLIVPASAQDAEAQRARIRAAMRASLTRQRVAIARQTRPIESVAAHMVAVARTAAWPSPTCLPVAPGDLAEIIGAAAAEHQIDSSLVREVARQESRFHPCAVSSKGAEGLMQLMPKTQAQLNVQILSTRGRALTRARVS